MFSLLYTFLLFILFSVLSISFYPLTKKKSKLCQKSGSKFIPGPPEYFFVKSLPTILKYRNLQEFAYATFAKYGGIMRCNVGGRRIIAISEMEILSEALKHKDFQGRPNIPSLRIRSGHGAQLLGITSNEGKAWSEQRKFTLRSLKELGVGKRQMETVVAEAGQQLALYLKNRTHQLINPQDVFSPALHMTLLKVLTGIDLKLEDPELKTTYELICGGDRAFFMDKFYVSYNILPLLTAWFPKLTGIDKLKKIFDKTHSRLQEIIDEHKKTINPDNPRDFIDMYLTKINETDDPNSGFYKQEGAKNLKATVVDLFGGESEPGSWTLTYAFLYLGRHPEVKAKVHEEIDRVLGSRAPTWEDKQNMPYTESTLAEVFRKNSLTHFSIPRSTTADTIFRGYFIEKGTIIMPWLFGVHHDKKYWGDDVDEFRPERFLIQQSDGSLVFNREKVIMPFGTGPRSCPGEQLARVSNFLYFTSILQQLDFQFDPNDPEPSMEPNEGLVLSPKPYKVIFTPRDIHSS